MTPKEIREFSTPELEQRLRDSRHELLMLRLRKQTGQVEKTHELRTRRKDIARLETILTEKKRAAAPAVAATK
jgi:large subunit ribosomal protein L29